MSRPYRKLERAGCLKRAPFLVLTTDNLDVRSSRHVNGVTKEAIIGRGPGEMPPPVPKRRLNAMSSLWVAARVLR